MSGRIVAASLQSFSVSPLPPPRTNLHQQRFLPKSIELLHSTSAPRILNFNCRCSSNGGKSEETRTVLDAFFLGKALAEAFSERVESAVGELLSTVGRWEAEQQKQIQEFQDDVMEKARRAKEQAAREALEEKGLILKSTTPQEPRINGVTMTSDATDSLPIDEDPSPELPDEY